VALNTLRSRIRERKVFYRGAESTEFDASAPVDQTSRTHARLELDRVRRVLSRMKTTKSEVLILHDVHGYNLNEIALMLNVTVAAAQSRLVRGRSEFRSRLNALEGRGAT
jgi:RNA polymerase sigma-70 factor (ECF subfamily)